MRPCKNGIKDLMCMALVIPLVWGISKKKKKKISKSELRIDFIYKTPDLIIKKL